MNVMNSVISAKQNPYISLQDSAQTVARTANKKESTPKEESGIATSSYAYDHWDEKTEIIFERMSDGLQPFEREQFADFLDESITPYFLRLPASNEEIPEIMLKAKKDQQQYDELGEEAKVLWSVEQRLGEIDGKPVHKREHALLEKFHTLYENNYTGLNITI